MGRAWLFAVTLAMLLLGASRTASAQTYKVGAMAEAVSGLEGGTALPGPFRRSRTTLRIGADLAVDEFPDHAIAVAALVEVEPRAGVGFDARYVYRLGTRFSVGAGGIAMLAPSTLIGGSGDFTVRFPIGKVTALTLTPAVNAFFLGGDLPEDTVIWQVVLRVGVRFNL